MAKNLWGDLPSADSLKTPVSVLREQAEALVEATRGVLRGFVEQVDVDEEGEFLYRFGIKAPTLNHYQHVILYVRHSIEQYPVKVGHQAAGSVWDVYENEKEFMMGLATELQSERVRKIVAALRAQSVVVR